MPNALFIEIEAKEAAAQEIRDFLEQALAKAQDEPDTRDWYAVRFDSHRFGIFDTFDGTLARVKHMAGAIGRGLMLKTVTSLNGMPQISSSEIVAAIVPHTGATPTVGSYAAIETRMGQGRDFGEVLVRAREHAQAEVGTLGWYALRTGSNNYAIFSSFADDAARQAHAGGIVAAGLTETVGRFIDRAPEMRPFEIIASKQSGWSEIALAEQQVHSEQSVRVGPKTA